ncbi:MAG: tetratricopeptide repeat protein, partial [Nitrospirae bacterium]
MSKFTAFLIIVFAAISAYLAFYNRETVDVFIGQHTSYEVSKITLMLISASVGALFMLLFYTVRDTKRFINNIQSQRKQKKQQKLSQLYSRAITAAQAGKQEQALSLLKDIVQEDDKHIDALLRLGEIYQQRGSLKEAQDYFKRVITLDGSNANALLRLAEIRLAQGLKEEALELVEEVLREDGQNFTALNLKSEILESLNRWDELVEHLRDVLKRTGSEEERSRIEESLRGYSYEL